MTEEVKETQAVAEEEVKINIRRIAEKAPATCISYPKGDGMEQWHPDPKETEFEVTPVIAAAAVASGLFEELKGQTRLNKKRTRS